VKDSRAGQGCFQRSRARGRVSRTALNKPDDFLPRLSCICTSTASRRPECNYQPSSSLRTAPTTGSSISPHGHYPAAHRRPADVHAGVAQQNRALAVKRTVLGIFADDGVDDDLIGNQTLVVPIGNF
jgi:hypothetical protein